MKKILLSLVLAGLLITGILSARNLDTFYSVATSTDTATLGTPDINKKNVRIKQIIITNGGTAQDITFYKNATSTTTATAVMTINAPASTPVVFPSNLVDDNHYFDIPYFAVRTSTSTNKANVLVIYKEN
jgi:hypothetical protein